jgi:hypothetical protein
MVLMVSYRDVFLSQIRFLARYVVLARYVSLLGAFFTNPAAKIALACAAI